ncbi:MAG: hypothetical protein A2Y62_03785 [Candidatus Fischerbacteria bacterium RBG_13_37_8]|uniref:FORGETTER1 second zinc ribbon domain-containing protein n=1 Tax=Candidatus Fischerbacteria bacterium RBG_13_37_8 TaxID=1817863 RepID=A0A1F5V807_9BACT|nr:MAG: hypothetical protein A2Y62_03785 [Candidatus Fischerbacteria bacterium RBG_13_37_8]
MIIICKACGAKLKVPENHFSKIKCPQCQSEINTAKEKESETSSEANNQQQVQAIIKKEVEKAKQELLNSIQHTRVDFLPMDQRGSAQKLLDSICLICSSNADLQNQLKEIMETLNYKVVLCKDFFDSGLIINNSFNDIIIIDEIIGNDKEAGTKMLRILNFLPADKRRKTFAVLLSSTYVSRDTYSAFLIGSNLIINKKDVTQFAEILDKELDGHVKFYKLYNDIAESHIG